MEAFVSIHISFLFNDLSQGAAGCIHISKGKIPDLPTSVKQRVRKVCIMVNSPASSQVVMSHGGSLAAKRNDSAAHQVLWFSAGEKSETVAEVSASQPNRQQKDWEAGLLCHGDFHKTSRHEQKSF
jgi:hypothetical protein